MVQSEAFCDLRSKGWWDRTFLAFLKDPMNTAFSRSIYWTNLTSEAKESADGDHCVLLGAAAAAADFKEGLFSAMWTPDLAHVAISLGLLPERDRCPLWYKLPLRKGKRTRLNRAYSLFWIQPLDKLIYFAWWKTWEGAEGSRCVMQVDVSPYGQGPSGLNMNFPPSDSLSGWKANRTKEWMEL